MPVLSRNLCDKPTFQLSDVQNCVKTPPPTQRKKMSPASAGLLFPPSRRISQLGDGHITRRDHNGLFFCKWLRELSSLTTAHPSLTSSTVVSFSCDGIHFGRIRCRP